MKKSFNLIACVAIALSILLTSCEKEDPCCCKDGDTNITINNGNSNNNTNNNGTGCNTCGNDSTGTNGNGTDSLGVVCVDTSYTDVIHNMFEFNQLVGGTGTGAGTIGGTSVKMFAGCDSNVFHFNLYPSLLYSPTKGIVSCMATELGATYSDTASNFYFGGYAAYPFMVDFNADVYVYKDGLVYKWTYAPMGVMRWMQSQGNLPNAIASYRNVNRINVYVEY